MESNQATWDQGFGPITMIPVAAGGLPPKGQDFNGIFNQISESVVYLSMGGRFKFSADYAAAINGYPKGAILQSDDEKKEYQSIIDNNKVNFNTATQAQINAAWKLFSTDDMLQQLAGKQPAGNYLKLGDYGIGGEFPPEVIDANNVKLGGIYAPAGAAGINFYDPYAPMFVMNRNGMYIRQFQITATGKIAARDIKGEWKVYSDDEELKTRFLGINSTAVSAKQLSTKSIIAGQEFYGKGETITITPQGIGAQPVGNYLKLGDYGIGSAFPPIVADADTLGVCGFFAAAGAGSKNYFDSYTPVLVMNRDNNYRCSLQINVNGRVATRHRSGAWITYPTLDEFNAKKSLGEGQRWLDVKGSRSSGVSYTNTTGRTIALSVSTAGAIASSSVQIFVDNVLCSRNEVGGGEGTNFTRHSIGYAIIPAGSSYKVEASSIGLWAELR
ncbi:hypothetical protein AB7Z54_20945 [Providencia manganoxydans]|uniref:hypothetical protein n=1 Tax=Providencia manganoxydans TaxID=2923283 RepID=UPI0032DB2185